MPRPDPSVSPPPGVPRTTAADLAARATAVLDSLGDRPYTPRTEAREALTDLAHVVHALVAKVEALSAGQPDLAADRDALTVAERRAHAAEWRVAELAGQLRAAEARAKEAEARVAELTKPGPVTEQEIHEAADRSASLSSGPPESSFTHHMVGRGVAAMVTARVRAEQAAKLAEADERMKRALARLDEVASAGIARGRSWESTEWEVAFGATSRDEAFAKHRAAIARAEKAEAEVARLRSSPAAAVVEAARAWRTARPAEHAAAVARLTTAIDAIDAQPVRYVRCHRSQVPDGARCAVRMSAEAADQLLAEHVKSLAEGWEIRAYMRPLSAVARDDAGNMRVWPHAVLDLDSLTPEQRAAFTRPAEPASRPEVATQHGRDHRYGEDGPECLVCGEIGDGTSRDCPAWTQCTTVTRDCLGGCRTHAEHARYNRPDAPAPVAAPEAAPRPLTVDDLAAIERDIGRDDYGDSEWSRLTIRHLLAEVRRLTAPAPVAASTDDDANRCVACLEPLDADDAIVTPGGWLHALRCPSLAVAASTGGAADAVRSTEAFIATKRALGYRADCLAVLDELLTVLRANVERGGRASTPVAGANTSAAAGVDPAALARALADQITAAATRHQNRTRKPWSECVFLSIMTLPDLTRRLSDALATVAAPRVEVLTAERLAEAIPFVLIGKSEEEAKGIADDILRHLGPVAVPSRVVEEPVASPPEPVRAGEETKGGAA